jgi:hypothetical protein
MEKFPRLIFEAWVAKGARAKIVATKKITRFIVFRILEKRREYKSLQKTMSLGKTWFLKVFL